MSSTDMTRDYLREFDEWWSPMEEQWKSSPKLIDIKGVVRVGYLAGRKADEEALLASKQEGRAEAVAYIEKYNESVGGSRFVIVNRKFLEAAKEEKV